MTNESNKKLKVIKRKNLQEFRFSGGTLPGLKEVKVELEGKKACYFA